MVSYGQGVDYRQTDFYDNKNGLSQGTVNAIVQDKFGYIWLGTQDGLNKFDGRNFTVFSHDRNDPNSIGGNFINDLIIDENGDLWIGTRGSGLNRYNISKGTFDNFRKSDKSNSISDNWVTSLVQDDRGVIWVGTNSGGLNMFDPKTNAFSLFDQELLSNRILDLHLDHNNTLWIGSDKGLSSLDLDNNIFKKNEDIDAEVLALWSDGNGHLWIGTNGDGLKIVGADHTILKSFVFESNNDLSLPDNRVTSLISDDKNKIWIGTDAAGLVQYDPITNNFNPVQVSYPLLKSLYKDISGDIWAGLRGGVNKINIKTNERFNKYEFDNDNKLIVPKGDIHALCVDNMGFIWSGSSVDGLKRIDRKTLQSKLYLPGKQEGAISSLRISYLFIDSDETMWVGTDEGLNKYNPDQDNFEIFNDVADGRINSIYEDSKGYLWLGCENGLTKMDRKTNEYKIYRHIEGEENSLHSNNVFSIEEDEEGVFWISLYSDGFNRVDINNNSFTHYSFNEDDNNSLSNDGVTQIYDDRNGNLWIATYGGGLNKFEKKTEKFTSYNENEGLANGSIYCVIPDGLGNLWMSHNKGFSKFDVKNEEFKNYFKGEEFNSRAYYKTFDGEIFLGGFYIVSFYPKNVIENQEIPPVHINEFRLFNNIITPEEDSVLLSRVIEEVDTIVLNYDQNFFSFGFVALNFTESGNNQFRYLLSNFDNDWRNASDYPYANYTNVPPGGYLFKVQGANNDGVWNEIGDTVYLIIKAPWWDSGLFKISLIIFSGLFLIVIYKIRTREIKRQNEKLEELISIKTSEIRAQQKEIIGQKESISNQNEELIALNNEKNEVIQIVAHDLRSPLNQIKGLASIIKMVNPNLNDETINSIDLIENLVDRQRSMISKILDTDAIDAKNINIQLELLSLNKVAAHVAANLKIIAENKNIALEMNLQDAEVFLKADHNYLIQIIENLLSNAVKFSPRNKKVIIKIESQHGKARLSIKDDGPGIGEKEKKFLFERYTRLSAKPTDNEDSSGLGLSIAKKYVEAMNGKLWCESTLGKGSTFIVEFIAHNE